MSDAETETLISSERVFSGRVVTLDVDQIRLPDGSRAVREVVRHRGAVVLLPVLDDGRIVSVRQYRYPVAERLLELPGGPRRCTSWVVSSRPRGSPTRCFTSCSQRD
jgi:ADP-ribose pyrophosphatase